MSDKLTFSATGLPAGLSLDSAIGIISGKIEPSAAKGGDSGKGDYTVTVTANDGNGGTVSDTFAWQITTGAPTATDNIAAATEDTTLTDSGNLITDDDGNGVDSDPNSLILSISEINGITDDNADIKGTYGTLNWSKDGSYIYTLDNQSSTVQALAKEEKVTDTFTYTLQNEAGGIGTANLNVTVTGVNDAPVATGTYEHTIADTKEIDTFIGLSTTLTATDIDGKTLIWTLPNGNGAVGNYGTLTVNTNGSYSYAVDNTAVNALQDGDVFTDIFTATVKDIFGATDTQTITINVTGTNDAAIIGGTTTGSVVEAGGIKNADSGTPTATGTLTANDPDNPPNTFKPETDKSTNYGLFSITAAGVWIYTLNNTNAAVEALNVGQTLADTITVESIDGTQQAITITINGANDSPVATGDYNHTIIDTAWYDTFSNIAGKLTASDIDATYLIWTVNNGTTALGTYGTLTLNPDGAYIYSVNSGLVNSLQIGQNPSDFFTATVTDSKGATDTKNIAINIIGTNDIPIASGTYSHSLSDSSAIDSFSVKTGNLSASDVDSSDTLTWSGSSVGSYGTLAVNANGSYTYTPNANAINAVPVGTNPTETFTATVTDSKGATTTRTITINITGANDLPTVSNDAKSTGENTILNDSVPAATDVDVDGIIVSYQLATNVVKGNLNFNPDGSYTFDPKNDFNALGDGATDSVTFTYTAKDNHGATSSVATVTITVNGVNDSPVAVDDSNSTSTTGNVISNDYDLDTGDSLTISAVKGSGVAVNVATGTPGTVTGTNGGTFTISADGSYTFNPGSDFNDLTTGQSRTTNITYTVSDSQGATDTATLTLNVTNIVETTTTFDGLISAFDYTTYLQLGSKTVTDILGTGWDIYVENSNAGANTTVYLNTDNGDESATLDDDTIAAQAYSLPDKLQDVRISSTDGSEFSAVSFKGKLDNSSDSGVWTSSDVTVEGYRDGLFVSGATKTFSNISANVWTTFDLSDNANFSNVDSLHFSFSTSVNTFWIDDIKTGTAVPPIAIDLNGNGLDFIPLDKSTVHFDMNDDGQVDRTAWVGPEDGILVIDLNGDKNITDKSEFVFTDHAPEASTDMEALQTAFDTDGDKYLTPDDARWKEFGIWQDADSDGKTDEGEFKSLDEMGVLSISLTNNRESSSPAHGIFLFGTSAVQFVDGHKAAAGDAAFSYIASGADIDNAKLSDRFTISPKESFNDIISGGTTQANELEPLNQITSENHNDNNILSHNIGISQVDLQHSSDADNQVFSSGEDMAHHTGDDGSVSDVYDDHRMDHQ